MFRRYEFSTHQRLVWRAVALVAAVAVYAVLSVALITL